MTFSGYSDYYNTPARPFKYLKGKTIESVKWGSEEIDVFHILYSYDPARRCTDGLLVTTTDFKDLEKRKRRGRYIDTLYIKARTDMGLWELKMEKTHIKELGRHAYWFRYDKAASHHILEKPT